MKRLLLTLFVMLTSIAAFAQNSHGSITGQVTDPSGAAVPKAKVTVTNTDTGAISKVATTAKGYYTAAELSPGPYKITVEAPGFKTSAREGLQIETQQNATVDLKLTVGETSETVSVTADTSLIDTADATTGQVLTTQEVQDLPNNGRSPLGFARDEYGAVPKAKHAEASVGPTAQQTADDFSLGGGNSASNEVLLNGIPDFQDSGRNVAFSPALDATSEVRVDVFGANSTYGDTSGGTVNITTKSGTNQLHGSVSEFYQAQGCSALHGSTFTSRSQNACTPFAALPYSTKVGAAVPQATHYSQYGGTIGGPIFIPKVFDGRNKLFFFYAYEGEVGAQPPTQTITTVPTAAERTGDFSALLALGGAYQLYNPYSATGTLTNYTKTAIPGNKLSNAGLTISPIAQAYYNSLPLPNYNGPTTTADGENNFFAFVPTLQNYASHQGRIDYNVSAKNRISGEAHRSKYLATASNVFNTLLSGTIADQIASGGFIEDVETFNATSFLDVRGSVTRYDNTNSVNSAGVNPTSYGFPGYIASNSTFLALPQITFSDATSPASYSSQPGADENFDTIQLFATFAKIIGPHQLKIGADIRAYKFSSVTPGTANGAFSFAKGNGNPVAATATAAPATFGSSFALFDLGIPTGGSYTINPAFQFNSFLDGFFLQDDWKISPTLTMSTGVRFEHETPVVESQNRMVNGFLPGATNEATVAANSAYAAHPSSLLPAASFSASGGATYASASNRTAYNPAPVYVSPRIGLIWAPAVFKDKFVVRAGYGIYTNPFNDYNTGQTYGYTGTSTLTGSYNSALNQIASLADPFPVATNPIQQPTGNALGVNANLGSKMVYYSPVIKVPYSERTSLDIQYSPSKNILVDIGYLNNHQVHLSYANAVDTTPLLPFLSRSPYYDVAANYLLGGTTYTGGPAATAITNPFKGLPGITGSYATAATLSPSQFLMSNPEFTSVTEQLLPGSSSTYNALNVRVAKRESHGLTLNGVFEWSRLLGTFGQLNSGDILNYQETTSDYPFHVVGYGTYKLPFGHGRQFFAKQRYLDPIIGGFQISAVYTFLSGMPISWGNVIYTGSGFNDFHNVQHSAANVTGAKVFNTAVFDTRTVANPALPADNDPLDGAKFNPNIQPNGDNYRTFPAYLLRQDYTSNWDANIQKNTALFEGAQLQLRLDVFNLLNRPEYNTPTVSPTSASFGTTSGVYTGTIARQLEVGAHIIF